MNHRLCATCLSLLLLACGSDLNDRGPTRLSAGQSFVVFGSTYTVDRSPTGATLSPKGGPRFVFSSHGPAQFSLTPPVLEFGDSRFEILEAPNTYTLNGVLVEIGPSSMTFRIVDGKWEDIYR